MDISPNLMTGLCARILTAIKNPHIARQSGGQSEYLHFLPLLAFSKKEIK
jgi:hypothetical protein